jgi:ABC transporter DrrB family efflux protein
VTTTLTPSVPAAIGARHDAGFVGTTAAVATRTVRKFVRTPQLIVVGSIQGAMFLLIFRYVFGGAISTSGVPYVDFLVPGFVATGVLFSGTAAAAGVAEDVEQGLFDRLRSLPIPRGAILAGRAVADTLLLCLSLLIAVVVGFAVGFRIHTDPLTALAGLALCVVIGFAFEWMFICIGLFARNAQAAQGMSLLVFPLAFVSSAYVPVESMPGWLQAVAAHQPLTPMVDAVRALVVGAAPGNSTAHLVAVALVWSAALVAVFGPVAVVLFRRTTAR